MIECHELRRKYEVEKVDNCCKKDTGKHSFSKQYVMLKTSIMPNAKR